MPVVLLSARAGEEARVEGLDAGADDYLVKPFSARELLARVGAHLQLGRAPPGGRGRFTAMADLAPALIWVADPDGRRVFVNAGWAAFTGAPGARTRPAAGEDRLHPDDRDRYRRRSPAAAAAARRAGRSSTGCGAADGAYHWVLERAVPSAPARTCRRVRRQLHRHQRPLPRDRAAAAARRGRRGARPRDRASTTSWAPGAAARRHPAGRVLRVRLWATTAGSGGPRVAAPDAATEALSPRMDPEPLRARTVVATGRRCSPAAARATAPAAGRHRRRAPPAGHAARGWRSR